MSLPATQPPPAGNVAPQAGLVGMPPVTITVHGRPGPQGSKRHVGRGIMVESSKHVKPWREAVKAAALDALDGAAPMAGAVYVEAVFSFVRPRNHYGTGRNAAVLKESAPQWPMSKSSNDVDKHLRSTFDALTDAGVWLDDAQVAAVNARKVWTGEHVHSLAVAGAWLRVSPMAEVEAELVEGVAS